MQDRQDELTIPLAEERLIVGKRTLDTGHVRVRMVVDEERTVVRDQLARERVEVERVPINREIEQAPAIRQEGDVTIIPVVREVLVVSKKLILAEELRVHRTRGTEDYAQPVTLRSERAVVEREQGSGEET